MLSRQLDMAKWLAGVAITVASILALSWALEEEGAFTRVPAMIHGSPPPVPTQPSKESILEMGRDHRKPQMGKASGLIDVEITAPNKGTVGRGSVIELEARVEAKTNLEGLKFAWLMPANGVTIVSGPLEGDLGKMDEGQSTVIRLGVQSETDENRQIHLNVFRMVNGEPMGFMSQYNTVDQEAIEATAKNKAETLQQTGSADSTEKLIQ